MMRKLLEAMTKFAGEPGEQWKGTDKGTPGKKLVGDSIIKDLSKGVTPKTKEEELAEAFANFNEDDLGVEEKRPHRTGTRADKVGVRGHKEQPRYKTVKDIDEDSLDNEYEGGESDNDYFDRQKPKKLSKRSQQRDNAADARKIGSFSVDGKVVRSNVNGLDHAQVAKELSNKYPGKNIEWKMTSKPFNEGWMNGSDRVNLPDGPMTYWNGTGRLQNEYNELYEKLVPSQGAAETIEGEVLRASSKIVYRHFNDGDLFNQASFDQLEQYIGTVTDYDDLAEKAIEFALKAQGNYHPNTGWDSLDAMDYGPTDDDNGWDEDDEYDDEDDTNWEEEDDELEESSNVVARYADDRARGTGFVYNVDATGQITSSGNIRHNKKFSTPEKAMAYLDKCGFTKKGELEEGIEEFAKSQAKKRAEKRKSIPWPKEVPTDAEQERNRTRDEEENDPHPYADTPDLDEAKWRENPDAYSSELDDEGNEYKKSKGDVGRDLLKKDKLGYTRPGNANVVSKGARTGKATQSHINQLKGNIKHSLANHGKANLPEGEHDAEFIDHEDNWYNMADWARAEFKKGKSVEEVIKYLRDNDYLGPRDINNFMKTVSGEKWNESVEQGDSLEEGRTMHANFQDWKDHVESAGYTVDHTPEDFGYNFHAVDPATGSVKGKFCKTHIPQNSHGFVHDADSKKRMAEGKHFRTAYGWAGGRNEKTGKMYKHPDQIKADREAKKAVAKDAMNNMFGGDAEDLTQNLKIREAGMPSSVIKHKQALASKTPEALYAGFKQVADKQGKSVESLARSAAWRHGYGKGNGQGSAHYWDKIKHLGETVSEADMFKAGQRAIKNIKSTTQQRKSEAEKMAIAQAQIDADRENERDRFSQEELYPSDDSHDLDESTGPEIFTDFNTWKKAAISIMRGKASIAKQYTHPPSSNNPQIIAVDLQDGTVTGVWDDNEGTGTIGQTYVFVKGGHYKTKAPTEPNTYANEGWEADLARSNRERMKKERAAAKPMAPIAKAKPDYSRVFHDINSAIGDTFPDGDPMDALMRKYRDSYGDLNIDLLNKACRVNSAKSYHDYVAKVWQQHMQDNPDLVQGGNPWVAEGEVSTRKYEMMLRNGQVKKFVAKDDADAKRIAAGHGAKSVIRMKGNVPGNKIAENDHPQHYVDRYNKDLERKIDKDFDPDYDRKMSDQEFQAKLKQRGKERDQSRINLDEEEIPDQSGIYITGQQGEYIDGPFDDLRVVRHEWDLHPEYYKKAHNEELTHEEAWERFGIVEGLGNLKNIGDLVKQSHDKIRASIQSKVGMTQDQINDAGAKKIKAKWKNIGDEIIKSRLGEAPQGVAEGWESGEERTRPVERDPDAEYDARRQEKLDAEADKAPKTTTYQCVGRGPNDEPNYKFGPEHTTQEEAVAYRKKLMANPKTPNPRDIGIRTISKVAKGINEDITSTDPLEGAVLSAVQELIQQGHTEVAPEVITNMVVAATSQPFLLKDLVDANNNSQAVQHYIDSISPSKVKFSSDMLTVKNEDPAKDKAKAQAGVSSMASRAANRSRLGESTEIQPDRIYPFVKSLQKFLYNDSKLKNKITPYDVGMRVWTRGDGVRMRDPARLEFNLMALRDYAFDLLKDALKGARSTQISGEFPSLPYGVGLVWKGKIIYKMGNFSIAIGSASRITNKNSVWKEKPMDEAVIDSSSNTTVVNNSGGSLYMASAAYMKQQAAKYQKHVANVDSIPAGPDTSKFSATRSGMIAFEKDVTVHGGQYGFDRFYQNFVKIGGNVDYDIKKKMEAEFRAWLATATGEANSAYVTPDRYYITIGDANGTNWGGYGLSFKKIDDNEWNKKYASLFNQYASLFNQSAEGVNEDIAISGRSTPLVDKNDLIAKRKELQKLQMSTWAHKDPKVRTEIIRRKAELMKQAEALGIDESRYNKLLRNKFQQIGLQRKLGTPESDAAYKQHVERMKKSGADYVNNNPNTIYKKVDEFAAPGMEGPAATTAPITTATKPVIDPAAAAKAAAATGTLKAAVGGTPAMDQALAKAAGGTATSTDVKALAPALTALDQATEDPKLAAMLAPGLKTAIAQAKTTP